MSKAELAQLMNVSEDDLDAFLAGLSVWVAKGFGIEQAIEKHMQTLRTMLDRWTQMQGKYIYEQQVQGLNDLVVDLVWDEVHA